MTVPRKQKEGNEGGENYVTKLQFVKFIGITTIIKTAMKRSTHAGVNKCSVKAGDHKYSK
jgi:hypothetical protein